MKNSKIKLKNIDDIKKIAQSGKIISDIFTYISTIDIEGLSTWEIDSFIDDYIRRKNGRAAFKTVKNFGYASCISVNYELVHGVPSKKKILKNGDIVKIDIGVVLNGFFSDSCYTFPIGDISEKTKKMINSCKDSLFKVKDLLIPGNYLGDIGNYLEKSAVENGYFIDKNFFGHGVGYSLHEYPPIPHFGEISTGIKLNSGMVFAIEPIFKIKEYDSYIIRDGWTVVSVVDNLSVQFEHTMAVTEHGGIILT